VRARIAWRVFVVVRINQLVAVHADQLVAAVAKHRQAAGLTSMISPSWLHQRHRINAGLKKHPVTLFDGKHGLLLLLLLP
jgi:hypothetical protein